MKSTILNFHRVNTVRDVLWNPLDPIKFREVITYVNRHYQIVSLEELCLSRLKTKKPPLSITFDDGFKDYIDFALPILKALNAPSSMFVVTDCVYQNLPTWTFIFDHLFNATAFLKIPAADYGEQCRDFSIFAWADKKEQLQYASVFKHHLKKLTDTERARIMAHLTASFEDVSLPTGLMMSWDDLRSLKHEQVEIGSHTVSHQPLATIEEETLLRNEIRHSGEIIQKELGFFPQSISYPVGSYNERVKTIVRESGYKIGLALEQKNFNSASQDLFDVPRIEIYNHSMFRNKLKISGMETAVKTFFKR